MNASVNTKKRKTKVDVEFIVKCVLLSVFVVFVILAPVKLLLMRGFTALHIFESFEFVGMMCIPLFFLAYSMFAKDKSFKHDDSNTDIVKLGSCEVGAVFHPLAELAIIVCCIVVVGIVEYIFI